MKHFVLFIIFILFSISNSKGQNSESFIPKDVSHVYTLNNVKLFEKISINELIDYDFMEELQAEVFDGSTENIALDRLGINLEKKFNVFYGKSNEYILSGCSFIVTDTSLFFKAFDDYEFNFKRQNALVYSSLMNTLFLNDQLGMILRVEPTDNYINSLCDSIWYERGNPDPFFSESEVEFESIDEEIYDENLTSNGSFPLASEDPIVKNYFELRDSLSFVLIETKIEEIQSEILDNKSTFLSNNQVFSELMQHDADAMFYMDNRNSNSFQLNWLVEVFANNLNADLSEIYHDNVVTGDFFLEENQVNLDLNINYNQQLGSIYEGMSNKTFNKRILKYIPTTSTGYFNYNLNLKNVYHRLYEVISPILEKENNPDASLNILLLDVLYETINDKKLFKSLNGNVFGYFNGIQSVPVKRIEFVYDEINFEYQEKTSTVIEDVPTFTFGMITDDKTLQDKLLNRMTRLIPEFKKEGNIYKWENRILNSLPLYFISNEDAILCSNDVTLLKDHASGFGKNALTKKNVGELSKNKLLYMSFDLNETLEFFPMDFLPAIDNNLIYPLQGKSGNMILSTISSNKESTSLNLNYSYPAQQKQYIHILDLINAMYVVSR